MLKILHPRAICNIKIDNRSVSKDILDQTLMFIAYYFIMMAVSILLVALIERNTTIAITGTVANLGNAGPGFGAVIGPLGSYAPLSPFTKLIFIIDMFVGRLELIPFIVLFQKDFWSFRK